MLLVARQQQKITFCLNLSVNYKIVYFERLKKPLRSTSILLDTCFDKYVL